MHDNIEQVHRKLLNAWGKSNKDMKEIQHYLEQLQVYVAGGGKLPNNAETLFTIFKDYYEICALFCILTNKMDEFEKAIKDVHQFYGDMESRAARNSQQQHLMSGLYLMYLLATNKLSEFHMFMELIDRNIRLNDPFLDVPVKLERYLSEGAYNKMTMDNLPSQYYTPFMNILKQAVRSEIALGLEKAYRSIPISEARKQLLIDSDDEILAFATKRGWMRKGNTFLIGVGSAEKKESKAKLALASGVERDLHPLESRRIINQCLEYAVQLERII